MPTGTISNSQRAAARCHGRPSRANAGLVDRDGAHVWNSAPQRLDFKFRVAYDDRASCAGSLDMVLDSARFIVIAPP